MDPVPEAVRLRLETGSCHAGSWGGLPVRRPCARRSARLPPSFEGLDDDHAAATAGAWRAEVVRFLRGVVIGRCGDVQEFAREREAGLASGAGKQAAMPDAVESLWQHVEQEAADELVGGERHDLLPVGAVATIVLVVEGDAARVEADEAAVRDRDPVREARQIGEHRLRAGEGRLGVFQTGDRWRRNARWSVRCAIDPKKASRPASCSATRRVRNRRRNSLPNTLTGSRNAGRDDIQRLSSSAMPPPGTIMCTCGWWVSPHAAERITRLNYEIDIREILPAIQASTLVLHREGDRWTSADEGRLLAERIPHAEFRLLLGNDHIPWYDDQNRLVGEVEEFLTGSRTSAKSGRALLMTDIVGSTGVLSALGDDRWRTLLELLDANMSRHSAPSAGNR